MATMNISLPDEMKEWVEKQADTGSYANVSDYVRDVLRREREMVVRFQGVVDESVESGVVELSPSELREDITRRSRKKILASAKEMGDEARKADDAA